MMHHKLLREYIITLLEDDEYGGYSDMSSSSTHGMTFGSSDDLYNTFIKPFTDVVDTAIGKTKELGIKSKTLVKVAFETIVTTLIPVLQDSYNEIFEQEKRELDKIRSEYAEVYKSNLAAFTNKDVMLLAFMYSPVAMLTTQFVHKYPKSAMKLVSTLSSGTLDKWLTHISDKFKTFKARPASHWYRESIVREDDSNTQKDIADVLTSEKLLKKLKHSQMTQKLESVGQKLVRSSLRMVFKHARAVLTANSLDQLQKATGTRVKDSDLAKIESEQERQKAEQVLLQNVKKSMREFYIHNLETQVSAALDAGVPESSPYIVDYRNVISKIKSL